MSRRLTEAQPRRLAARVIGLVLLAGGAILGAMQFNDALHGCGLCWLGVLVGAAAFAIGLNMVLSAMGSGARLARRNKRR